MCGRYASSRPSAFYAERYAATAVDEPPPASWNVAPTDPVVAVLERHEQRQVRTLRWGLVPSWADDVRIASRLINARAETVVDKPAFRAAFLRRRCLLPADGYYEWLKQPDRPKQKQPFYIRRRDGEPMTFAGLYEVRGDLVTCTVVTTNANDALRYVHDRMPVLLPDGAWDRWLDASYDDVEALRALLVPAPVGDVESFPVGPDVNSVRNNGAHLVDPVAVSDDGEGGSGGTLF